MYVTYVIKDENSSSEKLLLVIYILSVNPLVNIYNISPKNTIYNCIGVLRVAVVFAVIVFQLVGKYRQNSYVDNLINNSGICSYSFPTL